MEFNDVQIRLSTWSFYIQSPLIFVQHFCESTELTHQPIPKNILYHYSKISLTRNFST